MAAVKLTVARGKPDLKNVTVAAGTAISGSEAMELNIDVTKLTRGEALILIDALRAKIIAGKWPLL